MRLDRELAMGLVEKWERAGHRGEYLAALGVCALRRRAERLYQQLDALQLLRRQARHELIVECRKHALQRVVALRAGAGC